MSAGRWGGFDHWKDTTTDQWIGVVALVMYDEYRSGRRWLYSGHDNATAKEIIAWAKAKDMNIRIYVGEDTEQFLDYL